MQFVDLNDCLKFSLFGDSDAGERLRDAGVSGRGLRSIRGRNRTRSARRTDFCRPGRMRFFGRGRSLPTKALTMGHPEVFQYVEGQHVGVGVVVAINIPRGIVWVTP